MKALITGASSGIGRDIAKILSKMGYELFIVARSADKLIELKNELKTKTEYLVYDLSIPSSCFELYEKLKDENIDILINNAGYGIFGEFSQTSLEDEINMIDLNIKSVHILSKLFLKDFIKRNCGYILNVASMAGLMSGGPMLSSYYASKSYVFKLSASIYEELRRSKNNVSISVLCPGPVDTGFNNRAGVSFSAKSYDSYKTAEYALKNMFRKKLIIVMGIRMKLAVFGKRLVSEKLLTAITYNYQKSKK